jgi:HTH-type transcriptional regulator/antitoxin HigA
LNTSTDTLRYKVIKSASQYNEYCRIREQLLSTSKKKAIKEEAELLTVLIEKYRHDHIYPKKNPVQLLEHLLEENRLKPIELSRQLKISPGVISDILNYRKRCSKGLIRKLAELFDLPKNPFNNSYSLKKPLKGRK